MTDAPSPPGPDQRPGPLWKAVKRSEMRLVMSRLVSSLQSAGFTIEQQIDAAINLGRAFGVDRDYLKAYLVQNVSPRAALHRFFRRNWRPLFQEGERVRVRVGEVDVAGVVCRVVDPSELGLPGLDRPFSYLVDTGPERLEFPETDLHPLAPPRR